LLRSKNPKPTVAGTIRIRVFRISQTICIFPPCPSLALALLCLW
jgi:hypothetical protein